jgi:hypothetical protein
VSEIHRVTFEERLNRVQTNLHMVISEMLAINAMCETKAPLNRITTQLESAGLLFLGELRTTRDLLYQPRLVVEEGVLAAILATRAFRHSPAFSGLMWWRKSRRDSEPSI